MEFPRVKAAHDPVLFGNGRIRIGSVQYGVAAEIEDDADGTVWALLRLMDGSRQRGEIVAAMLSQRPDLTETDVTEYLAALEESGHIEDAAAPVAAGLSDTELDRYSRNENYFSWVDTTPRRTRFELQAALGRARVAVIGLGGSGSAVASSLVAAGVGAVRCVDFDVVTESNLNRQSLYTEQDIGLSKVARAVHRLHTMNSYVEVTGMERRVTSVQDARQCIARTDFAVLCADVPHPDIQLWINDAATELRVPWSVCFYAGPTLMTGIFVPGRTPCYHCLLHTGPSPLRADDGEIGQPLYGNVDPNAVLAPTAALAGQFGALETIRFLTGLTPQTVGRLYHQNLMIYEHSYYIEPAVWDGCAACRRLTAASRVGGAVAG